MMEKGFFHPDRGYWQTTSDPSEDIRAGYPEGTVEVPLQPGPHQVWDGHAWVPDTEQQLAEARATAIADVNHKAGAAKEADITWRDVTWQADARSTQALSARIASGEGATWIASDNSRHALSRADLSALMLAITTRTEKIVLQARAKKDAILKAKTIEAIAKVDTTINPAPGATDA